MQTGGLRRRVVVAANAVIDQGGQGLNLRHVIEALVPDYELTVFCGGGQAGGPLVLPVARSRLGRAMGRVPVVRRRRDWQTLLDQTHFDRRVAARLPDADAVVAAAGSALATFRAAKARGMGCVLDVTTTHVDHFGEAQDRELPPFGGRPFWHPRLRRRTRAEYGLADVIRVMSAVAGRTLTERGVPADKVFVAPPPVAELASPAADPAAPGFRVVFVGLIEPAKGFHHLIEAFDRLARPDAELTLWGGPGLRGVSAYLADRMARNPNIRLATGSVRGGGYAAAYGRSSVLVLPSLADGFGYVVGEAMSCGLPVVVTTATGAADLVEDGVSGFVVPPGDPAALAARLARLADDPGLRGRMGSAARAAVGKYTAERSRAAWRIGLDRALGGPKGGL